jgi:hypothetical protein
MVIFVAFYKPPTEPTNYSNPPYKYEGFNYIMRFLILEVFYVSEDHVLVGGDFLA